jgi:hypothetical protein
MMVIGNLPFQIELVFEMPVIPISTVSEFLKLDENLKNESYKEKFVRTD